MWTFHGRHAATSPCLYIRPPLVLHNHTTPCSLFADYSSEVTGTCSTDDDCQHGIGDLVCMCAIVPGRGHSAVRHAGC